MKYLPSKNIFLLIFIALIIVGGSFFLSENRVKFAASPGNEEINGIVSEEATLKQKDTDLDGIADWEEILLGTNPENADSDGDGVLDGEEFKSIKQYPNFSAEVENAGAIYGLGLGGFTAWTDNYTDSLFRQAGARYGIANESGTIDGKTQLAIVDSLTQGFPRALPEVKYVPSKIPLAENSDSKTTGEYFAKVIVAFDKNKKIYESDPVNLINSWLDTEDEVYLDELLALQNSFFSLTEEVAKLAPPKELAQTHQELLNNLYQTGVVLGSLKDASQDPIKGMLITAQYVHVKNKRAFIIGGMLSYYDTLVQETTSEDLIQ